MLIHQHHMCMDHKKVSHNYGFTLIEILVVIAIIGLMLALLTINLSRDLDRLARLEAERFLVIVNEVRDEAIITGESYLLYINEDSQPSYRFEVARQQRSSSNDDDLLRQRVLQKGLALDWEIFEDIEAEGDDKVLISPLGEITPFDAWFVGEDTEFHVFVNDENQLEQSNDDAK